MQLVSGYSTFRLEKATKNKGNLVPRDYRCPLLFQGEERQTTLGIRALKRQRALKTKEVLFI